MCVSPGNAKIKDRPKTNPRHREEETRNCNSHMTARTQLKQSNQLSLPQRGDFKPRKDALLLHYKNGPNAPHPPHSHKLWGEQ